MADKNIYVPDDIFKLNSKKRQLLEKVDIINKKIESIERNIKSLHKKYIICHKCNNWILRSELKNKKDKICPFCNACI